MKRVERKWILKAFALGLIFITYNGFSQSGPNPEYNEPSGGGEIKGKVSEKGSNTPMEYASIAIYSQKDSSLITGTVTDQSGQFAIGDLDYGKYYVELQFVGYSKKTIDEVVVSPKDKHINLGDISLDLDTEVLDEVEIVADQRRVEYKIDKKVVNVSEDLTAAAGTAVDVLENTPSVSVDIEGNVSLRGSSSFTVLINGKPTVLDGADALRQIPASNIQNIEIITNPSVKYDPDGNAGIINVVLKKQIEKGTTGIVNASVGLNHKYRFDALLNRRVGRMNYFIGGGYDDNNYLGSLQRTNIEYNDDGTEKWTEAEGDFDFLRGGSRIKGGMNYDISPKSNIAFEATGGTYSFGMDRSNTSYQYFVPAIVDTFYMNKDVTNREGSYYSGNLNFTSSFDTTAHKLDIMANFQRRMSDGIEETEYYQTDSDYEMLPTSFPVNLRNMETGSSNEFRFQVDYTKPFNNGTLEAGYQARIDDDLNDYSFQSKDPDTGEWQVIDDNSSEITFFRNIQGAYVQYGGTINRLQYQVGMRGEYTYRLSDYVDFDASYEINRFDYYPTLHLARQFENDQQLMLSYSKRVDRPRGWFLDSIPSYIDRQTVRVGNPGLLPEYIHSYELGYQKGWGKNFLAVEAYYRNTLNPITRATQYDEESGIFYQRFMNVGEDHSIGSEVMINWQFARWFKMNASTSVYYYRVVGELFGEAFDNSDISWRSNANTTFTLSSTSRIQATFGYRGASVTAQGSSEGMFYSNLAVRKDFLDRKLSATLQVRDIFGTMKREFTSSGENFSQYVIMQHEPRVVMLSLSYKINNYRVNPADQRGEQGGMEMDSGF